MKLSQLIITIGLALDIVGAIFLAKGFMAKKIRRIINESGTYISRNKWLQDSLIQQKIEALIGMIFLFSGFTLQAIGNFISSPIQMCLSPLIIFSMLIVFSVILFFIFFKLSKQISKKKILKTEAIYHKDKLETYNAGSLNRCGECLDILKEENESGEVYKKRIIEKIKKVLREKQ